MNITSQTLKDKYKNIKIMNVGEIEVVGVTKWEELVGKYIRIECGGVGSTVTKFGNLMKDDWMDFTTFGKEFL